MKSVMTAAAKTHLDVEMGHHADSDAGDEGLLPIGTIGADGRHEFVDGVRDG